MKPAVFEYHNPTTLSGALELLAQYGEEARALAGGQSLVPMMNFRLARPQHLIDLNRVSELSYIRLDGGKLRIGAMTRQRELERSNAVAKGWSLLADATSYIGHIQIRTRGTVGGSLAHAFPSAELPLVMTVLDAILRLRSISAERSVRAGDFFVGCMETELKPQTIPIIQPVQVSCITTVKFLKRTFRFSMTDTSSECRGEACLARAPRFGEDGRHLRRPYSGNYGRHESRVPGRHVSPHGYRTRGDR